MHFAMFNPPKKDIVRGLEVMQNLIVELQLVLEWRILVHAIENIDVIILLSVSTVSACFK